MSEQFVSSTSAEAAAEPRVFISYARSDGEPFATALRRALQRQNIPLWQDRVAMEGGRDWWLQIEEALKKVKFMVLVMTPNALTSPIVKKEWREARKQGVCVYPVKGAPNLDFASLPRWMRDAHFYDLGYNLEALHEGPEWETFIRHLNGSCNVPRVPFMVEDLPSDFVMRAEEDEIVSALLDEQREKPVAITAALRGAGGYGKTTLAMAICHNERVQEVFDDGVLWVTLGEKVSESGLLAKLNDLIYVLSGKRSEAIELRTLMLQFAELIAERDILLVIDDVWQPEHLEPFLHGGKRCARLITTRLSETLNERAKEFKVGAMELEDALKLLSANLPNCSLNTLSAAERKELQELARQLGKWALLLKLTNGVLRERMKRGQRLLEALAYVNTALDRKGFTAFDAHSSEKRNRAVAKSLGISLELLSADERKRFEELAIFPRDVDVPLTAVHRLWQAANMDEFATEALCERLDSLSLLLRLDLSVRRLRLHDAIGHYLHFQIRSREDGAPALHSKFLKAYGVEHWAELPRDEPYLWDHLAYHLLAADRRAELRAALLDYRYLQAKLDARDTNALLTDCDTCLHDEDDEPIGLVRSALSMSAHILAKDKRALAHQLVGRLMLHRRDHAEIKTLTERAMTVVLNLFPAHLESDYTTHEQAGGAIICILHGHTDQVNAVAYAPDGSRLISASDDATLIMWDAATGEKIHILEGHASEVTDVAYILNGSRLVSASNDTTLIIWDAVTGEQLYTLHGHTDRVTAVACAPDKARLISASDDAKLIMWDAATGEQLHTLHGHTDRVTAVAYAPDGSRLVSASADKTLIIWDAATGEQLHTLHGHMDQVTAVAYAPDGSRLVSASDDTTLIVWDAATGQQLQVLRRHTDWVNAVAYTSDGLHLVSASADKTLIVWDAVTGQQLQVLHGHMAQVTAVACAPDGKRFASASREGTLIMWETETGQPLHSTRAHTSYVTDVAYTSDGSRLVSSSRDRALIMWDATKGEALRTLRGHVDQVTAIAFAPDSSRLASASADKTLIIWDTVTGEKLYVTEELTPRVNAVAYMPDGLRLVSASDDTTLIIWNAATGEQLYTLHGHIDRVTAVACAPDGSRLVSASDDGTLIIWDIATRRKLHVLHGHNDRVIAVAYAPDGSRLVSASWDRTLIMWDAVAGQQLGTLYGHTDDVRAVVYSPDGSRLVSASWQELIVWDAATRAQTRVLHRHTDWVIAIAYAPDGMHLVSASRDKTLIVWNTATGEQLHTFYGDAEFTAAAWSPDGQHVVAGDETGRVLFLKYLA